MNDYISREAAISEFETCGAVFVYGKKVCKAIVSRLNVIPAADVVEVVRCRECRWWDKIGDSLIGYCHACKHGYYSSNWEISIHRTYKGDFFCADGERSGGAE